MANIDDELLQDAEEDARIVAFIQNHLPQELKEKFNEDALYYFLDLIIEYYAESGVLEAPADDEGYVEIDEEAVADYLAKKAKKEGMENFSSDELLFFVQAQMDYEEDFE